MVERKVGDHLLERMDKVIAFGDPGQLPPVNGQRAFGLPDYELTVNHRQRAGSRIINQALAVRQGRAYESEARITEHGSTRRSPARKTRCGYTAGVEVVQ